MQIHPHHQLDKDAGVDVLVGPDEAIVCWLSAHEHIDDRDGTTGRPWTTIVVDAAAAVIRGEYEIENVYRGSRLVRSRIIDTVDEQPRMISETGTLLSLWLPSPRPRRVERRRLNYGTVDSD